MKSRIIAMLAAVSILFSLTAFLSACTGEKETEPEVIVRPVAEIPGDTADQVAAPRPAEETSKTIQWINMDEYSNADLMMMATLQGNVNRVKPSMYLIHDEIVEGSDINGSQFWFDQLDQTYTGADAFTKVEYTDPYEMILANKDKIKGAVIYHERLTDAAMASRELYQTRYSDMALLNLTLMMCGQYEAIALNYIQYSTLKEEYGLELEILGDTTKFMAKNEDGTFSQERSDRQIWERVYKYALDTFGETSNREALGHNAGFQAGNFDYFVANKMFLFNRIFSAEATETERQIENAVMNVTKPNTPVFGCWYLQADEGSMVPMLTANYKYMVVTYESFNLSWTSGLPHEELDIQEEILTLDPNKNYIAFSFTEGDNNSYLQARMPLMYESEAKGAYPIGWTIASSCWETNPNIIRYCRMNWSDGDGLVTPESGVGYVYNTPPGGSQDAYFQLSDAYMKRINSGAIRMLQPDVVAALPFAEKMESLDIIGCGYLETGNTNYNNDTSHFLFRDTAMFLHYNGLESASLIQADSGTPGFYLMTLYGWSQSPDSVVSIMETLGDDFVAVTPTQLADLYKQYYGGEFRDVTAASFQSGMTRSEMGFLYKATDYSDYDAYEGCRMADGTDYFIYRFDLAEGVQKAVFDLLVSGDYQIEASTDYLNWTVLGRGNSREQERIRVDASSVAVSGQALYVRFGDSTPDTGSGVKLYDLYLTTNLAALGGVDIHAVADAAYLVDQEQETSTVDEYGRSGVFTYHLPLRAEITDGDLMVSGEEVSVEISGDGKSFTALPLHRIGTTWYGRPENLNGDLYIRVTAEEPVSCVRFSPTPAAVSQFSFSPVTNPATRMYLLSLDETEVMETTFTSSRNVQDDNVTVYRFVTDSAVTEAQLMLKASGIYVVSVSNDGENFTTLYECRAGESAPNPNTLDVTSFAAGGKTVYVKFQASDQIAGKPAKLMKLRLLSNLTTDAMWEKIDKERDPNATVAAGTLAEEYFLDTSRSNQCFLYQNAARCLSPNAASTIVYRYDTGSDKFFEMLGMEKTEVTKLRISYQIGNAYKISVSGDGVNWTEVTDTGDDSIQAASNRKDLNIQLTDVMQDGVAYVKISRSDVYTPNKTHDGLIWNTKFYIN